jgi:hypothetical protein
MKFTTTLLIIQLVCIASSFSAEVETKTESNNLKEEYWPELEQCNGFPYPNPFFEIKDIRFESTPTAGIPQNVKFTVHAKRQTYIDSIKIQAKLGMIPFLDGSWPANKLLEAGVTYETK